MLSVNKELAGKVIDAIEKDAAKTNSKYTFDYFCKTHNLYSDHDKVLGRGDYFICCPFHHDNTPSLALNENKRRWNCLGCEAGGKYLDFVWSYSKIVEGRDITWYQQVNELLNADKALQAEVHAETIFRREKKSVEEPQLLSYRKFKIQEKIPTTYPELASYMQKKRFSFERIKYALLLMQNEFTADTIYKYILNENKDTDYSSITDIQNETALKDTKYDLNELMEE